MFEQSSRHRAPQGILLGVAIMIFFYAGLWIAVRAIWPSHDARCHSAAAAATTTAQPSDACRPDGAPACLCAPRQY